jgi:hypothetical protein
MRSAIFLALGCLLVASCRDTSVVTEAREAREDGRTISNEMMSGMYPKTFRSGHPQYLERDFEAGADFICDQIQQEYDRDICAEKAVNWRN